MARLDDIQKKHGEAIAEFGRPWPLATSHDRRRSMDARDHAREAFADLLQYHKTFKGAVATAVVASVRVKD